MESEVEQDEDNHHSQRYQQLQAGLGADLVFPLPGPHYIVAGWKLQLLLQRQLCLGHKAPHVPAPDVEKDQRAEQPTFAVDLRSAGGDFQLRYHGERHLCPLHPRHEYAADGRDVVAVVTQVADPDREAVASLDGGGEHFPAEGGLDDILDIPDIYAIAGGCFAVDVDIDVVAAGNPFGHHVGCAVYGFQ